MVDWIEKAETAFGCAIAASIGLDPDSPQAADMIRFTNREDDESPRPARSKDVCYIAVSLRKGPWWSSAALVDNHTRIDKTLPLAAQIVFYGPCATINAEYCRTMIMTDRHYGSGRMFLEQAGIHLEAGIEPPTSLHEQEDGGWRKRCDLNMNATMMLSESYESGYVNETPVIDVVK